MREPSILNAFFGYAMTLKAFFGYAMTLDAFFGYAMTLDAFFGYAMPRGRNRGIREEGDSFQFAVFRLRFFVCLRGYELLRFGFFDHQRAGAMMGCQGSYQKTAFISAWFRGLGFSLLLSAILLPGCDTRQTEPGTPPAADGASPSTPPGTSQHAADEVETNPAEVSSEGPSPGEPNAGIPGLLPKNPEPSELSQEAMPPETERELDPYGVKNPWEISASKAFSEPKGATRLLPDANIWVDPQANRVIVDGYVTLDVGPLEMFACPVGTKEHESVVAVLSPAKAVHAGLVAVGTVQGTPVSFVPEYRPATGQRVSIWILWRDTDGKIQKARAQEWIQVTGEENVLQSDWVFAGSSFWTDPESGEQFYQADSGDLVCVSNFSTAMLDLPVESSGSNAALVYQAFSDKIPPRGTPVRLVFSPIPVPSDNESPESAGTESAGTESGGTGDKHLTPPEDALLDPVQK